VLTATILGSGVASLDATVVGNALPHIGKEFNTGVDSLQWVVAAYTLTLAAFLLLGGSLGDRMGRRKIFELGVVWFAIASLVCAIAPDAPVLIGARAVQGIGGALLTPGSLAILQASFVAEDRSRAIGAWSGFGGLAGAAGPLVGGYLLNVASWRWIFVINLPLSIAVLIISRRHVPESVDESNRGRIDSAGATWAVLALAGLTYALIQAPSDGWGSPAIVTILAVGIFSVGAFVVTELRSRNPLVPPRMFVARQFAATNAVTLLVYAGLGGALFLLPITLQEVAGYSPLSSGLALIPITLMMLFLSARSGKLASRIGPRLQMTTGPLIAGAGLWLLTLCVHHHNYFVGGAAGSARPRGRAGHHRGAADLDRHELGAGRARRHRVGGEQRRRPRRWPARGRGASGRLVDHRRRLPASGRAGFGVREGQSDLRRALLDRCGDRGCVHQQPPADRAAGRAEA